MARSVRIQYEGAVYHVMCRGDRREAIFADDADRAMFVATLAEMCGRTGMVVHSYVLMDNHYHLLLETPEGNLVAGMKWFQGSYTQRFNARHRLRGHLFQGRYKAIPVEAGQGDYFQVASDYIHLNPLRAGLAGRGGAGLLDYRWSSYPAFVKEGRLPRWLSREMVFASLGLPDEGGGSRRRFRGRMTERAREISGKAATTEEAEKWRDLRRGWFLGGDDFRERLMKLASAAVAGRKRSSYRGEGLRGHDEREARKLLKMGIERLGLNTMDIARARKTNAKKQALAWLVKSRATVSDEWICERLNMGHRSNISRAVRAFRAATDPERKKLKRILLICTD